MQSRPATTLVYRYEIQRLHYRLALPTAVMIVGNANFFHVSNAAQAPDTADMSSVNQCNMAFICVAG